MSSKATGGTGPVSPEDFVRAWQRATSVADVMAKTGMRYQAVYARVKNYRKHGVPLKELPGRSRARRNIDYAALAALVTDAQVEA